MSLRTVGCCSRARGFAQSEARPRAPMEPEAETEIVDVQGRFLTPGFINIHCHGGVAPPLVTTPPPSRVPSLSNGHTARRAACSHWSRRRLTISSDNSTPVSNIAAGDPLVLGAHLEGPSLAKSHKEPTTSRCFGSPTRGRSADSSTPVVAQFARLRLHLSYPAVWPRCDVSSKPTCWSRSAIPTSTTRTHLLRSQPAPRC